MMEARGAEVARAARLSLSATSAALQVLAEHGLAVRGRGAAPPGPPGVCALARGLTARMFRLSLLPGLTVADPGNSRPRSATKRWSSWLACCVFRGAAACSAA